MVSEVPTFFSFFYSNSNSSVRHTALRHFSVERIVFVVPRKTLIRLEGIVFSAAEEEEKEEDGEDEKDEEEQPNLKV